MFLKILSLFIFSVTVSVFADENIYNDIKTLSWKKINRNFNSKKKINRLEAFALARYHESYDYGTRSRAPVYYYSVLTGKKISSFHSGIAKSLLKEELDFESIPSRLAFQKLFHEISKRKYLSKSEQIDLLRKFPILTDPISVSLYEELASLMAKTGKYAAYLNMYNKFSQEEKEILNTSKIAYYRAYSYWKLKKLEKSESIYYQILKEPHFGMGREVLFDLKSMKGKNFYKKLNPEELVYLINLLPKNEQRDLVKKEIFSPTVSLEDPKQVYLAAKFFVKRAPSSVLGFLRSHKKNLPGDLELAYISEQLIHSGEVKKALAIQNEFLKSSGEALVFKNYARIYRKLKSGENFFNYVLKYLSLYPYDLVYNDYLIDYLAESKSRSIVYAGEKYWDMALSSVPDLPVKGRLIYWYLRYLKYSGKTEKLNDMLSKYYGFCSGSYYTGVIAEEFKKELQALSPPANPLSSKEEFIQYISIKQSTDYVTPLSGKNLDFLISPESKEMEAKINESHTLINSNPWLKTSVEYLRVGQFNEGIYNAHRYFHKENVEERLKNQILVGLGDLSNYTYLSLFYTRLLMKINRISDDILFLPKGIVERLYPTPHLELVKINSAKFGVEKPIVYAIMRQESFFRENAKSPANARGLMQVMPRTGRFLAKSLKVSQYSLHDPEVSIQFGTKFLADLLKNYNNQLRWASIAYNGGPGNLRKWKRRHYKGDFNHFLEELPSKESRDYCRIIISNYINYRNLDRLNSN
ncbi:MAG: lytic transglycosylase domain-containing protein [Leptospiraceae bacterium]|nr:lytic transglycosylase domain-containing protein [Leptospiraceae bacterium]MCP5512119.1 lytic transglycosylase domain-containing protein [Leptospiraceae bacterium]